ncbi:hypothetical protein ABL78_2259 [Leptomonas seymouri]|uniref:Uncharacterized protein n=1 Tax=Leptomonas seymouri TaxID=5684 RepID=A0A0N1IM08_LEPSE|nr:hypothetical protein ABL78_2259 [Leptomonas seymouri]|eukprot:KPI88655.1 hypothetical protein ABL78_2259 [Leptomonas seymouri]
MLRRIAPRLMLFTTGSGTALRAEAAASTANPQPSSDADEPVGVYLPWTARPWEVTHSAHHSQWKFLDTVLVHLATLTPAELSERAREQGAGDVLCDLEEPVIALRRQQARQARLLRQQEKAARLEAVVTSVAPAEAAQRTPTVAASDAGATGSLSALMSVSARDAKVSFNSSGARSSGPSPISSAVASASQRTPRKDGSDALEAPGSALHSTSSLQESHAGNNVARGKRSTCAAKKRKSKKAKERKTAVDVIHYV